VCDRTQEHHVSNPVSPVAALRTAWETAVTRTHGSRAERTAAPAVTVCIDASALSDPEVLRYATLIATRARFTEVYLGIHGDIDTLPQKLRDNLDVL